MSNAQNYIPRPEDTDGIELSDDLALLVEQIARNVHEVWAQGRMADGWTYDEKRDDAAKKHPCLVPYEQLTETEKDYDRRTCLATLKLVIKAGYKIEKI